MKLIDRARHLRARIEALAEIQDDAAALESIELFAEWRADVAYAADTRLRYCGKLYRVVQAHTSQADWAPDITPALYAEVAAPGEIPVWRQPTGAQDAYMIGDRVHYPDADGPVYRSAVDNNVWTPGVYGWEREG